jgi:predicted O-methyltransferase YrrM
MPKLLQKGMRYLRCYKALVCGPRPRTPEGAVDFCLDRPILMTQVRSEILSLGKLLQEAAPKRSLEIGTAYGGTLFFLCTLSPPDARIISVDLREGPFGGGYPRRKIPLFRRFPTQRQRLHLIQADSHAPETKARVRRILQGDPLDYLFIDGDHTYAGVKSDFEMYAPLVRPKGMIAFHDIVEAKMFPECEVEKFWTELKPCYEYREFIERSDQGWAGIGVIFKP